MNDNDLRRLAALIAKPVKEQGATPANAAYILRPAMTKFDVAFRAIGIAMTPQEKERVVELVINKLG